VSTTLNGQAPVTERDSSAAENKPPYPGIPTTSDGAGMVVWVETHITQGACAYPITSSTTMGGGYQAEVANGAATAAPSYREEVETELQRILQEAGLDTELEGILSDARAEAARRGVPMDSDLMLRALTDDTNGTAKLSDSAKGELKQRFQRIAAEERGEITPSGDQ